MNKKVILFLSIPAIFMGCVAIHILCNLGVVRPSYTVDLGLIWTGLMLAVVIGAPCFMAGRESKND